MVNKKYNFLHLTIDSRYGGIYRFIELWSLIDSEKENKVKHKTFKYKQLEKTINIINKKQSNIREYNGYYYIIDFIINFPIYIFYSLKSNVIIMHSTYLMPLAIVLSILGKRNYIISHDYNNMKIFKLFSRIFFKERHFFVAPWLENSFTKKKAIKENIILPLTNKYIKKDKSIEKNNIDYNSSRLELNLIYIGSLSAIKGLADLINMLDKLSVKCEINVIGRINKRYIKRINNNSNLHKIIYYNEIFDEKEKDIIFKKASFAIIPSRSEVFPFVYREYLVRGLIPLCNSIPVFNNLSRSKRHLFEINEPRSLEDCLKWAKGLKYEEYVHYNEMLIRDFNEFIIKYPNIESLTHRMIYEIK